MTESQYGKISKETVCFEQAGRRDWFQFIVMNISCKDSLRFNCQCMLILLRIGTNRNFAIFERALQLGIPMNCIKSTRHNSHAVGTRELGLSTCDMRLTETGGEDLCGLVLNL
jgi:hypothetical protein